MVQVVEILSCGWQEPVYSALNTDMAADVLATEAQASAYLTWQDQAVFIFQPFHAELAKDRRIGPACSLFLPATVFNHIQNETTEPFCRRHFQTLF